MLPSASEAARAVVGRYRSHRELRWRRVPSIRVHPARGTPTIYYLVPDVDTPHGGVRVAYRHVDLLNALGLRAAVLHTAPGFRATWFAHTTRVVDSQGLRFGADDLLVVPEVYGPSMRHLDPGIRVLVFNQGAYLTFDALDLDTTAPGSPYRDLGRLEGIMTVSRDSAELLAMSFPDVPVDVARPVVDGRLFHPGPVPDRRAFAYAPSRRPQERNQVLHMLRALGVGWQPVPLTGMSEGQVAETLRRVPLFVSFSDRDGFGLPPAEAMACGAYVVGYPGGGGEEFFDPGYCSPVRSTAQLVRELQRVMALPLDTLAAAGRRASAAVLHRYHEDGLRADLLRICAPLMSET
ncbi:glycosyltransferase [Nocardioides sp. 503]|uniref:glycosyltransferase n=1 Tax=Nocardioides sp. 503 TaxID=2508326 RepID=UPI00106FEB3B|nr:glycosyltransferase [Nocardioides sp. 503]